MNEDRLGFRNFAQILQQVPARAGTTTEVPALGLVLHGVSPIVPDGEEEVARYGAVFRLVAAFAADPDDDPARGEIFKGAGELVVTSRRAIVAVAVGGSVVGALTAEGGALVFALPWPVVDEVSLAQKTSMTDRIAGGRAVTLANFSSGLFQLEVIPRSVIAPPPRSQPVAKAKSDAVLATVASTAARAVHPSAASGHRPRLQAIMDGSYLQEDGEWIARLVDTDVVDAPAVEPSDEASQGPPPEPEPAPVAAVIVPRSPPTAPTTVAADTIQVATCDACSTPLADVAQFCRNCGAAVIKAPPALEPPANGRCPACRGGVRPHARFCPACGLDVPGVAAGRAIVATPEPLTASLTSAVASVRAVPRAPLPAVARHRNQILGIVALVGLALAVGSGAYAVTRDNREDALPRSQATSSAQEPATNDRDDVAPVRANPTTRVASDALPATETDREVRAGSAPTPDSPATAERRVMGDNFSFAVPSASGWTLGRPRLSNEGRQRVQRLVGPDGVVIVLVHTPDFRAQPARSKIVAEQRLDELQIADARRITLEDFPTDECRGIRCDDFVLNDPAFGGLAILANGTGDDPAARAAARLAATVVPG